MSDLTLFIPGLLGPLPEVAPPLRLSALQTLLSRGWRVANGDSGETPEARLFRLFGIDPGNAPPVAPLCRLGDGLDADGWWLRADPVHLAPSQDCIYLLEWGEGLGLTAGEAEALCALFNDHFSEEGWRLEAPFPGRWYLRLPGPAALATVPPLEVLGRDVHAAMPAGAAGAQWRGVMTEVQMLFHGAGVNVEREGRGAAPVNSLWFWGAGALPVPGSAPWDRVYCDGPLGRGLAALHGIEAAALPAQVDEVAGARPLVILEPLRAPLQRGDISAWGEALQRLEAAWFAPLLSDLRRGRWEAVTLLAGGERFALDRRAARRWWRRPRPLAHFLRREEEA